MPALSDKTKKAISNAMKNNTNAQKWTEKVVLEVLEYMLYDLLEVKTEHVVSMQEKDGQTEKGSYSEEQEKKVAFKPMFKTELLVRCKIFNRHWFPEMRDKFAEFDGEGEKNKNHSATVSAMIEGVDMLTETNLVNGALSGQVNTSIASLLMGKRGYAAKSEVKQEFTGNIEFEAPEIDESVMESYKAVVDQYQGEE